MSAPPAEITLTWARGLLEESVEDTGALALVLTALARELERPIAHESAGAPVSASIEHEADTCGISLRGDPDALRAAARRLPSLFTRPLIAEGSSPRPSSAPLWREDLLARTGGSALALQGLDALGPGARDEARRLLRELDPWRGTVNCLLRTDDRTLREVLAIAAPVRLAREPTGWADGTSRWRPGAAPGAAVVASPAGGELCSVMVPRTPDGSTVGELYTASDAALPAVESPDGLPSEWLDDGECVTGELRFASAGNGEVDLVYRNSLGDRIVWQNG